MDEMVMSHFLCTEQQPQGHKLEDLLIVLRKDLIKRMTKIMDDNRAEARRVLENDVKILDHLTACIDLAEDSTRTLDKAFGPSRPGTPRIGEL